MVLGSTITIFSISMAEKARADAKPIAPPPITKTFLSILECKASSANLEACQLTASGSVKAAFSKGTPKGTLIRLTSGTDTISAKVPSRGAIEII